MAKIDKSQYTKEEWHAIREKRRREKRADKIAKSITDIKETNKSSQIAFVLGNGTSRKDIPLDKLKAYGDVYGCNALYRHFEPDYLVAVDTKMILEINKYGYQKDHEVWTNPNKSFIKMKGFNYFNPSKGWSSGPTALWLASQRQYHKIFILGFDFKGLDKGKKFNNIYADSFNYKKSTDGATFFGNWMRQTKSVVKDNPNIRYFRVIQPDNYIPDELNSFNNLKHLSVEEFEKIFDIS